MSGASELLMNGEPELLERYEVTVRSYSEGDCREAVSFNTYFFEIGIVSRMALT